MDGMTRLKPCPFCGQKARAGLRKDNYLVIACANGCEVQASAKVPSGRGSFLCQLWLDDLLTAYEDAAAQWNTRWHDDD